MDRTTLTAALKPLERRGLVESFTDEKDRGSRRLTLTASGHTLLLRATPIWQEGHAALEHELGAGAGALRDLLAAFGPSAADRDSAPAEIEEVER